HPRLPWPRRSRREVGSQHRDRAVRRGDAAIRGWSRRRAPGPDGRTRRRGPRSPSQWLVTQYTNFSLSESLPLVTYPAATVMPTAEDQRTLALLKKCDVLANLPLEAIQRMLPGAKLAGYRARQVVYLPGDRAQGVFFVAQGRVKISKVTRDGKELTLAYRTGADFFGEPCLLEGGPREEMAEAMET